MSRLDAAGRASGFEDASLRASLRSLPAVDRLAAQLANGALPTPAEAVSVARAVLEERRAELRAGATGDEPDLVDRARERLAAPGRAGSSTAPAS